MYITWLILRLSESLSRSSNSDFQIPDTDNGESGWPYGEAVSATDQDPL